MRCRSSAAAITRDRGIAGRTWLLPTALSVIFAGALASTSIYGQRTSPAQHSRSARSRASSRQAIRLNLAKINSPDTRDTVGPHSEGEAVIRAAILLDRLKFSPGEISGSYNDNLAKAIAGFQSVSGLPGIGTVDAATWTALDADQASGRVERVQPASGSPGQQGSQGQPNSGAQLQSATPPALVQYVISMQDVSGPFTKIPVVTGRDAGERRMLREARLQRLNFQTALDLLAEKFHCSPRLLVQLNPRKQFDKPGQQIQVPNVLTPAPPQAASVVVDASTHSVTALDSSGKVLAFYPASVGSEHDPLPVGNWQIGEVTWYPKFKYNPNLFWDAQDKHPRATVAPGPRNPVGVVWMGLSKQHYGMHGTPAPSQIGKTQSHGCIRLTNWDAAELAGMVHPGMPVVLQEGTPSEVKAQAASLK